MARLSAKGLAVLRATSTSQYEGKLLAHIDALELELEAARAKVKATPPKVEPTVAHRGRHSPCGAVYSWAEAMRRSRRRWQP